MKTIRKTLDLAQQALSSVDVDCALIGGLALSSLGVHRSTMDVDLLVEGKKKELAKQALENIGFKLFQETDEVLHFTGVGLLDLLLANREPTQNMLKQAELFKPLNIKCVKVEDIIGLKIQAYINDPKRALQDKADIDSLIQCNSDLDWDKVKFYADLFNEWSVIEEIKNNYEL